MFGIEGNGGVYSCVKKIRECLAKEIYDDMLNIKLFQFEQQK